MKYTHVRSKGLNFGAPLKDNFHNGELHPMFKYLFQKIFLRFGEKDLEKLKRNKKVPENSRYVKGCLEKYAGIDDDTDAESLLYALREFLGSLPTPLLPKKFKYQYYIWMNLTKRSELYFKKKREGPRENYYLVDDLTDQLLLLPRENFVLMAKFFNFIYNLIEDDVCYKISKSKTITLVKYFSAVLFVRPYKPNNPPTEAVAYYPLLLLMCLKWPKILSICQQKQPGCLKLVKNPNEKLEHQINFDLEDVPNEYFRSETRYVKPKKSPKKRRSFLKYIQEKFQRTRSGTTYHKIHKT